MPDEERYANIREFLGGFIGARLVDITQHDREEFVEDGACYVALHFDNGATIRFDISEDSGFHIEDEPDDPPNG